MATNTKSHGTLAETVSANVRMLAASRRMSQIELGRQIGMTSSAVSVRWTDKRQWQLEDLEAIGAALGVEPADLLSDRWALRGSNPEPTDYESSQVIPGFDPRSWGLAA